MRSSKKPIVRPTASSKSRFSTLDTIEEVIQKLIGI